MNLIRICITICLVFWVPSSSIAMGGNAPDMSAGYQSMNTWDALTGERISLHIWYPATGNEYPVHLAPYSLHVARGADLPSGRYPLILLSHAMAESGLAHHDTAAFLARRGFIVAAPTHPGDNIHDTGRIFSRRDITDRPRHLRIAMDTLLHHEQFSNIVDKRRIAVAGFGTGGTAALLLAGASPSFDMFTGYCDMAPADDPYCSPWAYGRLKELEGRQIATPLHDERVKAAAVLAPGYGMLFRNGSMDNVTIPILIAAAERDGINNPPRHASNILHSLENNSQGIIDPQATARVSSLMLDGATSFTLHASCPPLMDRMYPRVCNDPDGVNRQSVHTLLNNALVSFFINALPEVPATLATPDTPAEMGTAIEQDTPPDLSQMPADEAP